MARKQCRLWWPKHLLSRKPSSDLLLFGWYMHSLNSLDIVVAVAISPYEVSVHLLQSDLQEILQSINSKMPMPLQESTTFSILGQCAVDFSKGDMKTMSNRNSDLSLRSMQCHLVEKNDITKAISCDNVNKKCKKKSSLEAPSAENCRSWNCGCEKLTQYIEPHREVLIRHGNWIRLLSKSQGILCKESRWIPEFNHMHQNGHILSICDVHLIIYEPPTYGRQHFSLSSWGYSEQAETPLKKPNWVNDLHQKSLPLNLEAVVSALNCASAAMVYFKTHLGTINAVVHFHFISRLVSVLWYMLAVSVASISTGIYVILQFFHRFVSFGSHTFFFVMLRKVFTQTWKNVHIRSCQFLYWPIFLQSSGFRSQSNIEYAHKSALRKHFIWSSVAMDLILGIIFGMVVLANVEAIWFWILSVVRHITDNLLRSGCVWLMGVPAGFKLNTELAELLGMVSLTAIHIFSTLWFFMGALFWHSIKGLALSGIFFGLTVPAALCIDMLKLAAVHILALHWLISFLYSLQIQALASLWRLFRGRKWNPLRQRLDSYDYTVEQHVVGSLFFTPLLLLLPTTSVFYIFFTILNTTISSIYIIIEITISILHATPYAEIFLWMVRRRRFPSGLWFEILPGPTVFASTSCGLDQGKTSDIINTGPETVVSLLHSNYATIGQIITPSYRNLFCRNNPSFNMPSAVLSGQRIPTTLQTSLPPTLPWMHISCREYWRLCHSAVLACRSSQ